MASPDLYLNQQIPIASTYDLGDDNTLRFRSRDSSTERRFEIGERLVLSDSPTSSPTIRNRDLPLVTAAILQSPIIEHGRHQLYDAIPLNFGSNGFHVLTSSNLESNDPDYEVIFIPRFPHSCPLGDYSLQDFRDLSLLSRRLQTSSIYPKLEVVKPIAASEFDWEGNRYTAFTTEYNPFGDELHVQSVSISFGNKNKRQTLVYPAYFHPVNIGENETINRDLGNAVLAFRRKASEIAGNVQDPRKALKKINDLPFAKLSQDHQRVLVRACAKIFAVSGEFPLIFGINSGDLMGVFDPQTLRLDKLTLVTARGGLIEMNEEAWLQHMSTYTQPDYSQGINFNPWPSFGLQELRHELARVRKDCS